MTSRKERQQSASRGSGEGRLLRAILEEQRTTNDLLRQLVAQSSVSVELDVAGQGGEDVGEQDVELRGVKEPQVPEPRHVGGGTYELPDGTRVRGKPERLPDGRWRMIDGTVLRL